MVLCDLDGAPMLFDEVGMWPGYDLDTVATQFSVARMRS
jgi:hypothetical protein